MNVPKDFTFFSGEVLSAIMVKYPDLRQHLTSHFDRTFASYKREVAEAKNHAQFLTATDYFCASVKQAYHFHVTSLDKRDLVELLPRTVFSAYTSEAGNVCGFVFLVPETVNAIDYHHRLYTDKLN